MDPNKAFKRMKNPGDKKIKIYCMECGKTRLVRNSVWWDDSLEIECFDCGNLFEWELAQ